MSRAKLRQIVGKFKGGDDEDNYSKKHTSRNSQQKVRIDDNHSRDEPRKEEPRKEEPRKKVVYNNHSSSDSDSDNVPIIINRRKNDEEVVLNDRPERNETEIKNIVEQVKIEDNNIDQKEIKDQVVVEERLHLEDEQVQHMDEQNVERDYSPVRPEQKLEKESGRDRDYSPIRVEQKNERRRDRDSGRDRDYSPVRNQKRTIREESPERKRNDRYRDSNRGRDSGRDRDSDRGRDYSPVRNDKYERSERSERRNRDEEKVYFISEEPRKNKKVEYEDEVEMDDDMGAESRPFDHIPKNVIVKYLKALNTNSGADTVQAVLIVLSEVIYSIFFKILSRKDDNVITIRDLKDLINFYIGEDELPDETFLTTKLFEQGIRTVCEESRCVLKRESVLYTHLFAEYLVTKIVSNALLIAKNAKRNRISGKDVMLAFNLSML